MFVIITRTRFTENKKMQRTRNYATVVYPESAPSNWMEILGDQKVGALVSPLHDKDLNPDGTQKKPHYHVLIIFDAVKTMEQAKAIFDQVGGVGHEMVQSLRGYARYLCHMDNPEKAQYDTGEVIGFGGADFNDIIRIVTDRYKALREMMDYIKTNNVECYADLVDYAEANKFEWFTVLCDSGTIVIKEYLKSRSWKKRIQNQDYAPVDGGY